MNYDEKNHYAYIIIGLMKKCYKKKADDIFMLQELDIMKLHMRSEDAISTLSVYQLKEILSFIEQMTYYYLLNIKRVPTYGDLRKLLRNDLSLFITDT